MIISGTHAKAARELLGWTRGQLARQAKIERSGIRKFELGSLWIRSESIIGAIQHASRSRRNKIR
jgi:transcriptional regulator with XRE-family HTH domain